MARARWYESAFDAEYLERYAHRDQAEADRQLRFLAGERFLPERGRILDLCCGAGRHSAWLCARGYRPVGLDLSRALLERFGAAVAAAGCVARAARGDMRRLPFRDSSFDAAIQMFTAFGYFDADDENRAVLVETARVLKSGAMHVLDLMNATLVREALVPESSSEAHGCTVRERRRYDAARQRVEKDVTVVKDGVARERHESVRVFDLDEIRAWLDAAGFAPAAAFGDFDGSAFDPRTSPRMIVVSRRATGLVAS